MSLVVKTGRLPHHGCPGYVEADAMNVTRGSGGSAASPFAPSRVLLDEGQRRRRAAKSDPKKRAAAWEWYAPRYLDEMRVSYRFHRPAWEALLARERVVLLCYCGTPSTCHRTLLADILVKLGAVYAGEVGAGDCTVPVE